MGKKSKKFVKWTSICAGVLLFVVVGSCINNQICAKREKALLTPLGELVEVKGRQMCVYTEGNGPVTLVFLSGGGTCSPVLDFKSLYSLLSDEYQIAVVEKFGYGFSDDTDEARDVDTVLEEARTALSQAGVTGPYVLCPHSLSGIQALYWAQKYPDEVSAVVGLDMAVPETYEDFPIHTAILGLQQTAARLGIVRLIPGIGKSSDAIRSGALSEREKKIYEAMFFNRLLSPPVLAEMGYIKDSARMVRDGPQPQQPMLLFVSNGQGTGWDAETWRSYPRRFAAQAEGREITELDCPHYVHDHLYERISADMKAFLAKI